MKIGVTIHLTDRSMSPGEVAQAAERRGFDSIYFPEHTHIPISRLSPPPGGGGELGEQYRRTLDPYSALAFAAAATSRIRIGTGIALVALHDPIALAKQLATLDLLSGGRLTLGMGFGWNREEIADHGVDFAQRRAVAREHVLLMQSLWTQEVASFEGEHARLSPSWSWPKPIQARIPVLLGGAGGQKLFDAIAEYGDGWMPVGGSGLRQAIAVLRDKFEEQDRDPAGLRVVVVGVRPDPGKLEYLRNLDVDEVVFALPSAPADDVLPVLDAYAAYAGADN